MHLFFILMGFFIFFICFVYLIQPSVDPVWIDLNDSLLMLFASEGGEKTEKPSAKKLQDARKKGQVVKSSDVNNLILMVTSFGLISAFGNILIEDIEGIMKYFFLNSYDITLINSNSNTLFIMVISFCIKLVIFIFLPLMLMGIVSNISQTGFLFTQESLKPKFDKLNPIKGMKDMFSRRRFLNSLKNIFLLIIMSYMTYSFALSRKYDLMSLPYMLYQDSLKVLGDIVSNLVLQMLGLVAVIAIFDYAIQRFEFMKNLKMTKQELKEEYKQMEGDPFVKGKRRQKQRELTMSRMMSAVSESTVIITNPTHFAVAIKYVHDVDTIPKVVTKGVDFKAQKIKELAKEKGVPIIENKPLARLLYRSVEVDQEIPFELYKAVAEILAIVYQLEKNQRY